MYNLELSGEKATPAIEAVPKELFRFMILALLNEPVDRLKSSSCNSPCLEIASAITSLFGELFSVPYSSKIAPGL
ncbi:MAG TPA: hypothetical protein VK927_05900 [Adhaeribacter sp.]|nr:hypothetical protein [Adhaeribacter sp.]